jgi:hypothetical protein
MNYVLPGICVSNMACAEQTELYLAHGEILIVCQLRGLLFLPCMLAEDSEWNRT